jgi:hydrogenase maturation protease
MKNLEDKKALVIGIGNDARQDDGLGWALLSKIEKDFEDEFDLIYRYQLNIEDADLIKDARLVIFADACKNNLLDGSELSRCEPNGEISFSTHALSPSAVLALSNQIYMSQPESYVLKMQGYEWELQTGLTNLGKLNLEKAYGLFKRFVSN